MAWRLTGTYVAACPCAQVCGCSYDLAPTAPDGVCRGTIVFHIQQGNLDALDLSGLNLVMQVEGRNKLSAGNWKVGLVIDERASGEQTQALERIGSGQLGGAFGALGAIFSETVPTQRAAITFSDGDQPRASVAGSEIRFEPFPGPEGQPTTVRNAMFGFMPEYKIGWGRGRHTVFGTATEGNYGEAADFEYVG